MSRFNQFTGYAGKLDIKGAETVEGNMVLNAAMPIIASWVSQCRLQQKQSGLGYMRKYLNTSILKADWSWNNGGEVLSIEVFSTPVTSKAVAEQLPKPEFADPLEKKSEQDPIITEPSVTEEELEEVQIENGLPPLPPELVKCFVVLFNDTDAVVYDMRSLEKGIGTQKPLLKAQATQGEWKMPEPFEIQVKRLKDYFGQAIYGGSNSNYWYYIQPYCLQMTNSEIMGPVAVAGVSFGGGIFSRSDTHCVYRLKSGFKSCQSLAAKHQVGQVGLNPGFPALNATDNMVYACSQTFTLSETGTLESYGSDVYGHDGDLSFYSVPDNYPVIPRFIDNNGEAHFDLSYNFGANLPSMGERWLTGLFDTTPNDYKLSLSVSGTGGSSTAAYPVLTQVNKVDKLEAKMVDISFEFRETDLGGNTYYKYGPVPESAGSGPGVFTVPYPPSENDYTAVYYDGELTLHSTFLSADGSGWDARPSGSGPEAEHVFLGFMQVSNGTYNLQGFALHSTSYDDGDHLWPLSDWYFYLDGTDFTSTMESITGAAAKDIQYAFMDVPFFSVQTIKLPPKS